mmetsp:Transcript_26720/g.44691  ORF Transcript_26720/g.44691 Transcript_26720/m.44691 type:complete len:207 (+) Transcript_26720:504-1124(+)
MALPRSSRPRTSSSPPEVMSPRPLVSPSTRSRLSLPLEPFPSRRSPSPSSSSEEVSSVSRWVLSGAVLELRSLLSSSTMPLPLEPILRSPRSSRGSLRSRESSSSLDTRSLPSRRTLVPPPSPSRHPRASTLAPWRPRSCWSAWVASPTLRDSDSSRSASSSTREAALSWTITSPPTCLRSAPSETLSRVPCSPTRPRTRVSPSSR